MLYRIIFPNIANAITVISLAVYVASSPLQRDYTNPILSLTNGASPSPVPIHEALNPLELGIQTPKEAFDSCICGNSAVRSSAEAVNLVYPESANGAIKADYRSKSDEESNDEVSEPEYSELKNSERKEDINPSLNPLHVAKSLSALNLSSTETQVDASLALISSFEPAETLKFYDTLYAMCHLLEKFPHKRDQIMGGIGAAVTSVVVADYIGGLEKSWPVLPSFFCMILSFVCTNGIDYWFLSGMIFLIFLIVVAIKIYHNSM